MNWLMDRLPRTKLLLRLIRVLDPSSAKQSALWTILLVALSSVGFSVAPLALSKWVNILAKGDLSGFLIWFLLYALAYGIGYIARDFQYWSYSHVEKSVHEKLSALLLKRALDGKAEDVGIGTITTSTQGVQSFMYCFAFILIPFSFEIIGMQITIMSGVSFSIGIMLIVFILGFFRILMWSTEKISIPNKSFVMSWNQSIDFMSHLISRKNLVNSYHAESFSQRLLSKKILCREKDRVLVAKTRSWTTVALNAWVVLMLAASLVMAIYFYRRGQLNIGEIVAIESVFFQLLRRMEVWARGFRESAIAMDQCTAMVNYIEDKDDVVHTSKFKFPSVDIKKGSWNLLVGPTGCGKSTYLTYLKNKYSNQAQLVSQKPEYLALSLEENLSMGTKVDKRKLLEVIEGLDLKHLVDRTDGRSFPILLEDGTPLSGGELQRLAVARALLSEKPILLLDEPTSSQSEIQEKRVLQYIKRNTHGKTIVIVSHRPSARSFSEFVWKFKSFGIVRAEI